MHGPQVAIKKQVNISIESAMKLEFLCDRDRRTMRGQLEILIAVEFERRGFELPDVSPEDWLAGNRRRQP